MSALLPTQHSCLAAASSPAASRKASPASTVCEMLTHCLPQLETQRRLSRGSLVLGSCLRLLPTAAHPCSDASHLIVPSGPNPMFSPKQIAQCTLAGGLVFGWNSLALIIKQQGNYQCSALPPPGGLPLLSTAQSSQLICFVIQ